MTTMPRRFFKIEPASLNWTEDHYAGQTRDPDSGIEDDRVANTTVLVTDMAQACESADYNSNAAAKSWVI